MISHLTGRRGCGEMLRGRRGIGWMIIGWLGIAAALFLAIAIVAMLSGRPLINLGGLPL